MKREGSPFAFFLLLCLLFKRKRNGQNAREAKLLFENEQTDVEKEKRKKNLIIVDKESKLSHSTSPSSFYVSIKKKVPTCESIISGTSHE